MRCRQILLPMPCLQIDFVMCDAEDVFVGIVLVHPVVLVLGDVIFSLILVLFNDPLHFLSSLRICLKSPIRYPTRMPCCIVACCLHASPPSDSEIRRICRRHRITTEEVNRVCAPGYDCCAMDCYRCNQCRKTFSRPYNLCSHHKLISAPSHSNAIGSIMLVQHASRDSLESTTSSVIFA